MNRTSHNKGQRFPAEPLTREEVKSLLNTCSRRSPTGRRDRALIAVLWRGQLRISEALALKPADFNVDRCTLRVLRGKGGKARTVAIDRPTADLIVNWLEARRNRGINGHRPIFCTLRGGPISTAQIRQMLPRRARKAGITKRVHAHGLRHTGASELVEEGFPLMDIQEQLGHASAATTNTYLHHLNPKGRVDRLRTREW